MTHRPATDNQIAYLKSMIEERDLSLVWTTDHDRDSKEFHSTAARSSVEAARAIWRSEGYLPEAVFKVALDYLKAAPRKAQPKAEPGYYVTADGTAVKVQSNKAGTGTYALVWSGSSWDYAPGLGRTLAGMVPMTAEDAARLGLASGRCINCCRTLGGASLTAKVAALVGYGEICADNNGWAFPKGAATQRAYLAATMAEVA